MKYFFVQSFWPFADSVSDLKRGIHMSQVPVYYL